MIRSSVKSRRGYALLVVISLIALMMTFLIAAHGSAVLGKQQMQRRFERMDERHWIDRSLARAAVLVDEGTGIEGLEVVVDLDAEEGLAMVATEKPPQINPYGIHLNLEERSGDHVVEVVLTREGGYRVRQLYLLNHESNRAGPIRLQ